MKTLLLPCLALLLTACGAPASEKPDEKEQTAGKPAGGDVCQLVTGKVLADLDAEGFTVEPAEVDETDVACQPLTAGEGDLAIEWSFAEPESSFGDLGEREEITLNGQRAVRVTSMAFGIPQSAVYLHVTGKVLTVEVSSQDSPFVKGKLHTLEELKEIAAGIAAVYAGREVTFPKESLVTGAQAASKELCAQVSLADLGKAAGASFSSVEAEAEDDGSTECAAEEDELGGVYLRWIHSPGAKDLAALAAGSPPNAREVQLPSGPALVHENPLHYQLTAPLDDAVLAVVITTVDAEQRAGRPDVAELVVAAYAG